MELRAHGHIAGVVFGEFVAEDSVCERGAGRRYSEHWDLNKIVAAGVEVNPLQFVGVNQILGVMCHDDVETLAGLLFVESHVLVDPVEAIRLRGGPVMRTERQVDRWKAIGNGCDCVLREVVVRISSGEDVIGRVADRGQIVLEHLADDGMLLPQRHENRNAPRGGQVPAPLARQEFREPAGEPGIDPREIDLQIVEAADQQDDRQRRQRPQHGAVEGLKPGWDVGDHLPTSCASR